MIDQGKRLSTFLGLDNNQPCHMTRMAQMLAAVGARHTQDLRRFQYCASFLQDFAGFQGGPTFNPSRSESD